MYLAFYCTGCKQWSSQSTANAAFFTKTTLVCKRCQKTKVLKKSNQVGLSTQVQFFDDGMDAAAYVAEMNMQTSRKRGGW